VAATRAISYDLSTDTVPAGLFEALENGNNGNGSSIGHRTSLG